MAKGRMMAIVAAFALGVTACGGDSPEAEPTATTAGTTTTTTAAPTTTAAATSTTAAPTTTAASTTTTTAPTTTTTEPPSHGMAVAYEEALAAAQQSRPDARFLEATAEVTLPEPSGPLWTFTFADPADGWIVVVYGHQDQAMRIQDEDSWDAHFFSDVPFTDFDKDGLAPPFDPATVPIGPEEASAIALAGHEAAAGPELEGRAWATFADTGRTLATGPFDRYWLVRMPLAEGGDGRIESASWVVDADTGEAYDRDRADLDRLIPVAQELADRWADEAFIIQLSGRQRSLDEYTPSSGWWVTVVDQATGSVAQLHGHSPYGASGGFDLDAVYTAEEWWDRPVALDDLEPLTTPIDLAGLPIGYFAAVDAAVVAFEEAVGRAPSGNYLAELYVQERWPEFARYPPWETTWLVQFLDEQVPEAWFYWVDPVTGDVVVEPF